MLEAEIKSACKRYFVIYSTTPSPSLSRRGFFWVFAYLLPSCISRCWGWYAFTGTLSVVKKFSNQLAIN